MELSNDFEVLSELKFLLENRASNVKIVCLCTRVHCDDYQDYTKGTKGKTRVLMISPYIFIPVIKGLNFVVKSFPEIICSIS